MPIIAAFAANALCAWFMAPELSPGTWMTSDIGRVKWVGFSKHSRWVFPKIGVPQNGWFMMENKVPLFLETPQILFAACCFGDLRRVLIDIEGEVRGRPMILDDTFGIDRFFASQRLT